MFNRDVYLEEQIIISIGYTLEGFCKTQIGYRARCPVCGDSRVSKSKKRFNIVRKPNGYLCYCFNCDYSASLITFLKTYHDAEYRKYIFTLLKDEKVHKVDISMPIVHKEESALLKPIKYCNEALEYLKKRNVPVERFDEFGYVDNFDEFIKSINDEKEYPQDRRIVAKLTNLNHEVRGFQGRSLEKSSELRYATIKLSDDCLFGLDKVSFDADVIVTEGVYDSVVVRNGVAILNAKLQAIDKIIPKEKCILVYDNEIYNQQVMSNLKDAIGKGFRVFIPPKNWRYKDLNIASEEISIDYLTKAIKAHSYSGIVAMMKFSNYVNVFREM